MERATRLSSSLASAFVAASLLAACGSGGDSTSADRPQAEQTSAEPESLEAFGGQELIDAATKEGRLTLYTAMNTDQSAVMVKAFEEQFPGISVESVERTGGPLQEIIRAENQAGKLRADVIEQSDPALMVELSTEDKLIADYEPPSAGDYPEGTVLEGRIYPAYVQLHSYAYNTQLVKDGPPSTWEDFLDPAFNGRRTTPAPAAGGCAWVLSMFQRKELGPDYWEKLAATNVTVVNSNTQMIKSLGQGETMVTTMLDPVARGAIAEGAPVAMVYPKEGVAPCQYAAGTVVDSPNPNAGKLWLNWLLSESGQSVWVKDLKGYSARTGMDRPEGLPDDVKIWEVPFDEYMSLHDSWIAEWNKIFNYTPK
jgi:iron(III) transport system substrate-binding protein